MTTWSDFRVSIGLTPEFQDTYQVEYQNRTYQLKDVFESDDAIHLVHNDRLFHGKLSQSITLRNQTSMVISYQQKPILCRQAVLVTSAAVVLHREPTSMTPVVYYTARIEKE